MQTYFVKCKSNQYNENHFRFTRKNGKPNIIDTMQLIDNMWIILDLNTEEFMMMKDKCHRLGLNIALKADNLVKY